MLFTFEHYYWFKNNQFIIFLVTIPSYLSVVSLVVACLLRMVVSLGPEFSLSFLGLLLVLLKGRVFYSRVGFSTQE